MKERTERSSATLGGSGLCNVAVRSVLEEAKNQPSTNAAQHKAAPMREELLEELGSANNSTRNNGLQPGDMSIKADPGLLTTPCLPVQKRRRTCASISLCYPWPIRNPKRPPLFFPLGAQKSKRQLLKRVGFVAVTINENAWEHKERAELVVSGFFFFPPRRRTRQGPRREAERTIRPLLCFYIACHWAHRGQDSNADIILQGGAVTVIIA